MERGLGEQGGASERRPGPTHDVLGAPAPSPRLDRDLAFARVEQRLLGRTLSPVKVGRFVVLGRVGHGGMGVVYRALDPELDRRVAVKIVDDGAGSGSSPQAQDELLREARAAATLAHPNVVTVYEAGTEGDAVYLAMEYVSGPTLRRWLKDRARGWREIVTMFAETGRGLVAAHAAGLVHRDFKPDNVLIGEDGRPRVADFGLARPVPRPITAPGEGESAAGEETFTAIAGTPRYMAPEQHEGRGVGPASDQFAFCVALYEALFDCHPFAAERPAALVRRVMVGEPDPPGTAARGVPPAVVGLVMKGLQGEIEARHGSMAALIDGLQRALLRRGRIALGGAALLIAGAAALAGYQAAPEAETEPCAEAEAPMQEQWNPQVRAQLEAAFAATGRPGAEQTAALVADKLERYASAWGELRQQTCRATELEGEKSTLVMELGYACLDRRRYGMSTLLERLLDADAATVGRASAAVDALVPLSPCGDRSALMRPGANALRGKTDRSARPEADAQWGELLEQLHVARVRLSLGERDEARASAETVAEQARADALRGVEASALQLQGEALLGAARLDEAEPVLRRAVELAVEAAIDEVAVDALVLQSRLIRRRREHVEQARFPLELARGLARRSVAPVLYGLRVAIEQAQVDMLLREHARAREGLEQALAAAGSLGPEHAEVMVARNNLGAVLQVQGELVKADQVFTALLPAMIAVKGPAHPKVAMLRTNLGVVAHNQGHHAQAVEHYAAALSLYADPRHARRAEQVRFLLGVARREQGRPDEAAALQREVLAARRERLGPEHADLAEVLDELAEVERQRGNLDEAVALARRAIERLERAHGPDYLDLRAPLVTLGKTEIDRSDLAAAVVSLERAYGLVAAAEVDPVIRAEVCFDLARALVGAPAGRARARELADEAHRLLTAAGERAADERAAVEAWRRAHAP